MENGKKKTYFEIAIQCYFSISYQTCFCYYLQTFHSITTFFSFTTVACYFPLRYVTEKRDLTRDVTSHVSLFLFLPLSVSTTGNNLEPSVCFYKTESLSEFFKKWCIRHDRMISRASFFLLVFSDFDLLLSALFLYCRKLFFVESSIYEFITVIPKHIVSIINRVKRFV